MDETVREDDVVELCRRIAAGEITHADAYRALEHLAEKRDAR
mgnify:CR=1 FL=1